MKQPIVSKVSWEKEGTIIDKRCYLCPDCKEILNRIGSAGCNHDESYTYFYQCGKCKLVLTSYEDLSSEDFKQYGWKLLEN